MHTIDQTTEFLRDSRCIYIYIHGTDEQHHALIIIRHTSNTEY